MSGRTAQEINDSWTNDQRWKGVERTYNAEAVLRLRGSYHIEHSIAKMGSQKLWKMVNESAPVVALGASTGNQAVEQVSAGLRSIYLSGWQVAGDANSACQMYPDQSLYPVDSVPRVIRGINNALLRADQINRYEMFDKLGADRASNTPNQIDWLVPIVADAEAGFGGNLNVFELVKSMVENGASGIHLEDQVASQKKCGHLGGKVLVPTREFIDKLIAARLAADVMDVPAVIIARTDAQAANLITCDIDERDHEFLTGERTHEGFHRVRPGLDQAISRALSYAPYCDMIWCETSHPNLDEARRFSEAVRAKFPGKLLAYNCSPSFNWSAYLSPAEIAKFRDELAKLGYAYQFITLAGFHTLNSSMFELASAYKTEGMTAYARLQDKEHELTSKGYTGLKHQRFVGTGYFDAVNNVITSGQGSTAALHGSTEQAQFK